MTDKRPTGHLRAVPDGRQHDGQWITYTPPQKEFVDYVEAHVWLPCRTPFRYSADPRNRLGVYDLIDAEQTDLLASRVLFSRTFTTEAEHPEDELWSDISYLDIENNPVHNMCLYAHEAGPENPSFFRWQLHYMDPRPVSDVYVQRYLGRMYAAEKAGRLVRAEVETAELQAIAEAQKDL